MGSGSRVGPSGSFPTKLGQSDSLKVPLSRATVTTVTGRFTSLTFSRPRRGPWAVVLDDLYSFDLENLIWTLLTATPAGSTPPNARTSHGFTSAGGVLYVHGGIVNGNGGWTLLNINFLSPPSRSLTRVSIPVSPFSTFFSLCRVHAFCFLISLCIQIFDRMQNLSLIIYALGYPSTHTPLLLFSLSIARSFFSIYDLTCGFGGKIVS